MKTLIFRKMVKLVKKPVKNSGCYFQGTFFLHVGKFRDLYGEMYSDEFGTPNHHLIMILRILQGLWLVACPPKAVKNREMEKSSSNHLDSIWSLLGSLFWRGDVYS